MNEAIEDGASGVLRRQSVFAKLGPSYLDDAFKAARQADPDALLFYNNYDGEAAGSAKSEAILALVKRLKESGVPIDGVGLQSHLDPRRLPDYAAVKKNMERLVALGLTVNISELDVPVGAIPGDTNAKLTRQAEIYGLRQYVPANQRLQWHPLVGFHRQTFVAEHSAIRAVPRTSPAYAVAIRHQLQPQGRLRVCASSFAALEVSCDVTNV